MYILCIYNINIFLAIKLKSLIDIAPIEESFSSNPKTDTLQRMTSMGSATFSQSSMPSSMLVNPPEEIAKCEKEYFSPLEKALKTAAITAGTSRLISALLENIEDESIKIYAKKNICQP